MKKMFEDAKVGDRVWSMQSGWGEVVENIPLADYGVSVKFDNNAYGSYSVCGRFQKSDLMPTLFWNEVKFEIPKKPLPDLEVDTKVLVWDRCSDHKYKRYFSHFDKDGTIYCFENGRTSWTEKDTTFWENWEIAEEELK
jgi:hypothetical protein